MIAILKPYSPVVVCSASYIACPLPLQLDNSKLKLCWLHTLHNIGTLLIITCANVRVWKFLLGSIRNG